MGKSPEYSQYICSEKWKQKSGNCQKLTGYRCVIFPWLRSRHAHHMTYENFKYEMAWRDTVPLSKTAHWIIHLPVLWRFGNKPSPVRLFVNLVLRFLFVVWIVLGVLIPEKKKKRKRGRRKRK